jgi:hypothetical protein
MSTARKEWMLGIPGHNELCNLDQVLLLVRGGSLRPTDLVKKLGEPWRAANEVTELAPHFSGQPPLHAAKAMEPMPLKAEETHRGEPIRVTTDRVPKLGGGGKIPDSSKTIQKVDSKGEAVKGPPQPEPGSKDPVRSTTARVATVSAPPKTEVKPAPPPAPPKESAADTKPPPLPQKEEKKPEPKPEPKPDPKSETGRGIGARKPVLPRPPVKVEPTIEPMVAKYYSPVDMLRCASFAFEPKKLLYCLPSVFIMSVWFVAMNRTGWGSGGGVAEGVLYIVFMAFLVFSLAIHLTALAFVSRRQLEGRDYYAGEVVHYTMKNLTTALVYPIGALFPSLLSLGILYLLGLARNRSGGMATTLRIGFIIPMIFAFITVLGALVYQIASMYIPAAGAIEGERLSGAARQVWNYVKRQWGRVVLHWLIVTVAFGVISAVCLGLAYYALQLPDLVFGVPDEVIARSWNSMDVLQAIYRGIATGLGMVLPLSLLSTLGTLSYLSLRTPAGAQLSPSPMDDTSGMAIASMSGTRHPGDSTNPADTRPADTRPGDTRPPASEPLSDISDDSDEQPLVKD